MNKYTNQSNFIASRESTTEQAHLPDIIQAEKQIETIPQQGNTWWQKRYSIFPRVEYSTVAVGIGFLWIGLIILLPLAALAVIAAHRGFMAFFHVLFSTPAEHALSITFSVSALVTVINVIFGVIIAWLLERESWPGKTVINSCIDIPFALPTIVVSMILLSLYGNDSPLGLDAMGTPLGLIIALAFVTFPFIVRQVQPVLKELEMEIEEAAASLGATNITIVQRILLPALWPAIITGAGLTFTRAIGEYGSLILIGGNIPGKTQVASQYIAQLLEIDDTYSATVISLGLIIAAFIALNCLQWLMNHQSKRKSYSGGNNIMQAFQRRGYFVKREKAL